MGALLNTDTETKKVADFCSGRRSSKIQCRQKSIDLAR